MTPAGTRIATLVAAALVSGLAILATIDGDWETIAPLLRFTALGAWVILAINVATDRVVGDVTSLREEVNQLRAEIDTYGDQRQSDGWIDREHAARSAPTQPNLKRVH
jgi:hypothetical protein